MSDWPNRCWIQHRIGHLELGEPSVIIVVRAAHRAEAYAASRYAIDELKTRAPIWKEEHYADGDSRYLDGVPLRKTEKETD
jgi:molybdopterin synthase catalytic subunit